LGYWPREASLATATPAAFATATMQMPYVRDYTLRCYAISPAGMGYLYKIAANTKLI